MKELEFKGYKDFPITIYVWDEVEKPKAVVQLVHGMVEHLRRYDRFATALNKAGYIVIGDDHRAHGHTVKDGRYGVAEITCFDDTINDIIAITEYAEKEFKLPIYIFGHSYGSFLTQAYLQRASEKVEGAIICGSARQDGLNVKAGAVLSEIQYKLYGADKPAKLIDKMAFGGFDRYFKAEKQDRAWLSSDREEVEKNIADPECNFIPSIGFYYSLLHGCLGLYTPKGLSCIRKDLPLLIVSGDRDPVGGNGKLVKALYDTYAECAMSNIKLKLYNNCRHELLNEVNRQEVTQDLIDFLDSLQK